MTALGLSVVALKSKEEKPAGLVRAAFNIEVFKKLHEHFDQHKIPPCENFKNTLTRDYDLDHSLADDCIAQFKADGKFAGLIREIAGADRVSIHDAGGPPTELEGEEEEKRITGEEKVPNVPSGRRKGLFSRRATQNLNRGRSSWDTEKVGNRLKSSRRFSNLSIFPIRLRLGSLNWAGLCRRR